MKREIKFRVWDGETIISKSRQDEYDDYYMLNLQGEFFGHTRTGDEWFDYNKDEINKKHFILMQFTGLTDKNGKEIYEGDIVKTGTDKLMVITWNKRFASFCIEREGWAFSHWFGEAFESTDCEVVGNIHENPELLNEPAT